MGVIWYTFKIVHKDTKVYVSELMRTILGRQEATLESAIVRNLYS